MGSFHTMMSGETLEALARARALPSTDDIFDAPENAALRDRRATPQGVRPGDRVFIPDAQDVGVYTRGGMSGRENAPVNLDDEPTSDPEIAPGRPLADEPHAIVLYAARNRMNTIDAHPAGFAWFSA